MRLFTVDIMAQLLDNGRRNAERMADDGITIWRRCLLNDEETMDAASAARAAPCHSAPRAFNGRAGVDMARNDKRESGAAL